MKIITNKQIQKLKDRLTDVWLKEEALHNQILRERITDPYIINQYKEYIGQLSGIVEVIHTLNIEKYFDADILECINAYISLSEVLEEKEARKNRRVRNGESC